jgi:hypothetical protein
MQRDSCKHTVPPAAATCSADVRFIVGRCAFDVHTNNTQTEFIVEHDCNKQSLKKEVQTMFTQFQLIFAYRKINPLIFLRFVYL